MSLRQVVPIQRGRLVDSVRDKADRAKAAATLAQLAQNVLDSASEVPAATIAAVVRCCCPHIASASERQRLWTEYLTAVEQESAILDGLIGWADVDPEITAVDRTQTAIDIAVEMSKQALEALVGGAR